MSAILNLNLDLKKIPSSAVYKGAKGNYVKLTVFVSDEVKTFKNGENEQHQNVSAIISQTKEQREAKADRTYVANGSVVWVDENNVKTANDLAGNSQNESESVESEVLDGLPF